MKELSEIDKFIASVKADWWKACIPHKEHEAFQIGIDEITEQVAERTARIKKDESVADTMVYLRKLGIPFEAVFALSKKIGNKTT